VDHFFDTGCSLARLKTNYHLEGTKWELLEFIFLISFISSIQQDNPIFSELLCFEQSLPIVLKLSFKILLRTLEKMKIQDLCEAKSPLSSKNNPRHSSGKRRRQEELLTELQEERNSNKNLRIKIKEKELEIKELKTTFNPDKVIENSDARLYGKIRYLEESLYKNREAFDEKNLKIAELNKEIQTLADQIDILKEENQNYATQLYKFKESYKKIEQVQKLEKDVQDLNRKLKESYNDKDLLMIEIQNLRVNSRRAELLESQISSLCEEKFGVCKELSDLKARYDSLKGFHDHQTELLTQIPILKEEISFLKQRNDTCSSQRPSSVFDSNNLLAEELEARISELTEENNRLKTTIKEKETVNSLLQQIQSIGSNNEVYMLKYSKLECDYYELKLQFNQNLTGYTDKISFLEKEIADTKHERDLLDQKAREYESRVQNIEKTYSDNNKTLENLRTENFKLREINNKLKASNELERLKGENMQLHKDIAKLKSSISESAQINYTLKAEISHLYDIIEDNKKESLNIPVNSDNLQDNFVPLTDIVINNQIGSLEQVLDTNSLKESLEKYLIYLRTANIAVTTKTQAQVNELNTQKNQLIIQLQEESRKRFEAEKKSLSLLKKFKEYEDLI
jgi:chromosome segregation ATPase